MEVAHGESRVYILENAVGRFYIGSTDDARPRLG